MNKNSIITCIGGTLALNAGVAATNQVSQLEPIMVSAMLVEKELKDVPLSVSVLTQEDIQRSTASTTAGLMADIPGVEIYDGGMSGMMRVGIRGESDRTLVLIDGLAVSEQKAMSGAPILISPEDIERIEVIKGPGSVLYGSEAIGGVVNIITKKGAEQGVSSFVRASYDTAHNGGEYTAGATYVDGPWKLRVSGTLSDYDNRDSAKGEVEDTDWSASSINASLDYLTEDVSAGVQFNYFDGEYSVYTGSEHMMMDLPEWTRMRLNSYYEKRDISDTLVKFRADAYYQRTEKTFINDIDWANLMGMGGFGTWTEYKDTQNTQDTVGLKLQADLAWGNHYTIVGTELTYDRITADDYSKTESTGMFPGFGILPSETYSAPDAKRLSAALFVQDEWSFAEDWSLVLGYRATASETSSETDSLSGTAGDSENNLNGTASIALVNTSIEDVTLRAVLSQGYRQPTLGELYTTSGMAGEYITGNPDLTEETSTSFELGARYVTDQLMIDVAAFYTKAEDYIDYVDDPTAATGLIWENMDEATTFGGELYVKYDLLADPTLELAPYVNATLMRRKYINDGDETYDTGYPTLKGRLGLRGAHPLGYGKQGWFDAYVRCASDADTSATESDAGWATVNLSMGMDLTAESRFYESASFEIGLMNIFDKYYTEARNSIESSGRGVYLSASFEF